MIALGDHHSGSNSDDEPSPPPSPPVGRRKDYYQWGYIIRLPASISIYIMWIRNIYNATHFLYYMVFCIVFGKIRLLADF